MRCQTAPTRPFTSTAVRRSIWAVCLLGAALAWPGAQAAPDSPATAPAGPVNRVDIDAHLSTSGQPSRDYLATLKGQGFEAVVSLVPTGAPEAVADEGEILSRQGLSYVHLPIAFGQPTDADVAQVFAALRALDGRRVLLHCELNFRASSMAFLWRVIERHQDPAQAYEALSRVWAPNGAWRRLIEGQLRQHQIAFELD